MIQPIEVEARAYVEAYRQADGSLPNYRCDLIEGLLDEIAKLRAMMPPSAATRPQLDPWSVA